MHRLTVRMKDVKSSMIIEAALDERLSFRDNFRLLEELLEIPLTDAQVYDPYKKIFLDRNIVISDVHFGSFMLLHLFC